MTTYQVSFEQMEFVGGEMDAITQQIQRTLTDLDDGSKQSLAEWSSDARDAYNIAKAKWDAAAAEMQKQAVAARQALGHIDDYYQHGEKYGTQIWNQ
ncbi:WXG100 family type VII secretion target [Streptomyces sp. NPDC007162]|uniref:WXG100 family type VII secretion target n=1 Tax=Streptomyces sp. NPDC007162 TaxID=3156917 RepID=UPI00340C74C0